MTRLARLVTGVLCLTFLACGALIGPSTASERSSLQPMYRASANDDAREAASVYSEAAAIRKDVRNLTSQYIRDYGDRLSAAERAELKNAQKQADLRLSRLVSASKKYRGAVRAGTKPYKVKRACKNLENAWKQGKKQSEISTKSVRQILEPKLSFLEKLSALNELNEQTARYDDLGDRINKLAKTCR